MEAQGTFHKYETLWHHLDTALVTPGSYSTSKLRSHLEANKQDLLSPLKYAGRSDVANREVMSGSVQIRGREHQLSEEFKKEVTSLSTLLELNELLTTELLVDAREQQARFVDLDIAQIAVHLFHKERTVGLHCILSLLKERYVAREHSEYVKIFTNELINKGLANNICHLISKYTKELSTKVPETNQHPTVVQNHIKYKNEQRKILTEILFYIYYSTTASTDQLVEVYRILEEATHTMTSKTSFVEPTDHYAFQVSYALMVTLFCMMDVEHPLMDASTGEMVDNPLDSDPHSSLVRTLLPLLSKSEPSDNYYHLGFQRSIHLSLSLFMKARNKEKDIYKRIDTILRQDVLLFLKKVAENPIFRNDDNVHLFLPAMHDLVQAWLQDTLFWENSEDKFFGQMMDLIATLAKDQPVIAIKYWIQQTESAHLPYFIQVSTDRIYTEQLFVPYLHMLTSLTAGDICAYHAYTFLKTSKNRLVNWDNFFHILDQYYADYAENQYHAADQYNFNPQSRHKVMRKEDGQGMQAILQLIQEILKQDERIVAMMCENSTWHPLETLFGLLICPLQSGEGCATALKAQVTLTIASFVQNRDLATKIWAFLESSQVLQTVVDANVPRGQDTGIKYELEEIEAGQEEYPFTIAFCRLINDLCKYAMPSHLGNAHRDSGLLPYLAFIRDSVFRRFDERAYKSRGQQWHVAAEALRLFNTVLTQYQFSSSDFSENPWEIQGRSVRVQKSMGFELLRNFLTGHVILTKLLNILAAGHDFLAEQREEHPFFEEAVLLSLEILNQVMAKEDRFVECSKNLRQGTVNLTPFEKLLRGHTVIIANYINYDFRSGITLFSIKLLHQLSQVQEELVDRLDASPDRLNIIVGYAAKLQTEEVDEVDEEEEVSPNDVVSQDKWKEYQYGKSIRLAIVDMLLDNIDQGRRSKRNIVYFLLGWYDGHDLHNLGILTCLRVILDLLSEPLFSILDPALSERMYKFIYRVCTNAEIGTATLNFLRVRDFFCSQLREMDTELSKENRIFQLNQRGWLLKLIALELHCNPSVTSKRNILSLLLEGDDHSHAWERPRLRLLEYLEAFHYRVEDPPALDRSPFVIKKEQYIIEGRRGHRIFDIHALHSALLREKQKMEAATSYAAKHNLNLGEQLNLALSVCVRYNQFNEEFGSQIFAFQSWKQVVEVALMECYGYFKKQGKEVIMYDLLAIVLEKQNSIDTRIPIATHLADTVLVIIAKLRQQRSRLGAAMELPSAQLQGVLQGILTGISRNGSTPYMRGSLYSSLMNYLSLTSRTAFTSSTEADEMESQQIALEDITFRMLEAGGEKLLKTLSMDASDGADVWKSVALSTLDVLMSYDRNAHWLYYLAQSGHLAHFIADLKTREEDLLDTLKPNPDSLAVMYTYESNLSLLSRIAGDSPGAKLLLENRIIQKLFNSAIVQQRPEDLLTSTEPQWIPAAAERYSQLLHPVLRLIISMVVALPQNEEVASQILEYSADSDLFYSILKDANRITVSSLQSLSLVTSLFYKLAHFESSLSSKASKFRGFMLRLLDKYCQQDKWMAALDIDDASMDVEDDHLTLHRQTAQALVREIIRNIIGYCRIVTVKNMVIFGGSTRGPSLLTLVQVIKVTLDYHLNLLKDLDNLNFKLSHVNDAPEGTLMLTLEDTMEPHQRQHNQLVKLNDNIRDKNSDLEQSFYVLENALWILWKHLDHFLGVRSVDGTSHLDPQFDTELSPSKLDKIKREVLSQLERQSSGRTESPLTLLTNLKPKRKPDFIYFLVGKLRSLLR